MTASQKSKGWETMSRFCLILLCLVFAGCMHLSPRAAQIIEADEGMIQGCKFLTSIDLSKGYWGFGPPVGIAAAKTEFTEKAAQMEATHIYWTHDISELNIDAYGKAYKCP